MGGEVVKWIAKTNDVNCLCERECECSFMVMVTVSDYILMHR